MPPSEPEARNTPTVGRVAVVGPPRPCRFPAPDQLEAKAGPPPLRFCHARELQTPRLGPLGPVSPLPTPFGPRHQHKERGWLRRKGMWNLSPLGRAEAGGSGICSCQVALGGPRVCKPPPTTGPQSWLPAQAAPWPCRCPSHRPELTLAGWARVEAPGPDWGADSAPPSRKHSKHHTLKPKAP